eukprot:Clim_evm31s224 gene=Clim_evmTU31s224
MFPMGTQDPWAQTGPEPVGVLYQCVEFISKKTEVSREQIVDVAVQVLDLATSYGNMVYAQAEEALGSDTMRRIDQKTQMVMQWANEPWVQYLGVGLLLVALWTLVRLLTALFQPRKMSFPEFRKAYGPWAVVLGASEGLGLAFARECCRKGLDIVIVARRKTVLEEESVRIMKEFPDRKVVPMQIDLLSDCAPEDTMNALKGKQVGLVIYNAALSCWGYPTEQTKQQLRDQIKVNVTNYTSIMHQFAVLMKRDRLTRGGGLITVSSLSCAQGVGVLSGYCACKSYQLRFAEAQWYEFRHHLKSQGSKLTACVAFLGKVGTPAYHRNTKGMIKEGFLRRTLGPPVLKPIDVAAATLEHIAHTGNSPVVIPGSFYRLVVMAMGLFMNEESRTITVSLETEKLDPRSGDMVDRE